MKGKINKIKDGLKKSVKRGNKVNFKNLFNNKKNIITLGIFIVFVLLIILIVNTMVFSKLEKVKINEVNNKISEYIDEVALYPEDEGKYVSFAIEYLYNTTEKNKYTFDEVLDVINSTFAVDYDEKKLIDIGISVQMANKGIVIEGNNKEYTYNANKTQADIASTTIVKYNPKAIKRVSVSKYKVTYDKYVVENPYTILNYYDEKNLNAKKPKDTKEIVAYLRGFEKVSTIKKYINEDNIKDIGKVDGKITITFIVKNNKVLIKKIG